MDDGVSLGARVLQDPARLVEPAAVDDDSSFIIAAHLVLATSLTTPRL